MKYRLGGQFDMYTSSGQFSVFVQLPYNFPEACDLADEEISSSSLEVE